MGVHWRSVGVWQGAVCVGEGYGWYKGQYLQKQCRGYDSRQCKRDVWRVRKQWGILHKRVLKIAQWEAISNMQEENAQFVAAGSMCWRGVQKVLQEGSFIAGYEDGRFYRGKTLAEEACDGYSNRQYVQEWSGKIMKVCSSGVWRVYQWAVCAGERWGRYDNRQQWDLEDMTW